MAGMTRAPAHLVRIFVAGLLAALPLAATLLVFWWLLSTLVQWLGPTSAIGSVLVQVGLGVTGSAVVGYLLGLALVVAIVFGLGLLVEAGLQRALNSVIGAVMQRIPVVRTVYDFAHKMTGLFAPREDDGLRSMSPVWCHFGGVGGAAALALLSTPEPAVLGERRYLAVIVPTAPVPVGGGLLYVPQDWVTPAELGVEALTSIYISLGVTSPQHLAPARAAARFAARRAAPAQPDARKDA
jgi:uncharacterized membrane protein